MMDENVPQQLSLPFDAFMDMEDLGDEPSKYPQQIESGLAYLEKLDHI